MVVFLCWCFCGGVFCGGVFCGGVFLWWSGCVFVVFLLWCFCGGVFCGGVVVFLVCFCGGVLTCDNVCFQSATQWTASVHTLHMSKL